MASVLIDLVNDGLHLDGVDPQSITATTDGTGVDCHNITEWMVMMCQLGALTATSVTFSAQESSALASGYAAVIGSKAVTLSVANTVGQIMFQRTKKYVRCEVTITGGPGGGNLVAARFLGQRKIINPSGGGSSISPQS
jgi:hypothetical protein